MKTETILLAVRDQLDDTIARLTLMAVPVDIAEAMNGADKDAAYSAAKVKYGRLGPGCLVTIPENGQPVQYIRHYPPLVPLHDLRDRLTNYINTERGL